MIIRISSVAKVLVVLVIATQAAIAPLYASARQVSLLTGTRLDSKPQIPDFTLIDDHGRPFLRRNLLGSWSVLFFGYTECADVCPATLLMLSSVAKNMRAAHQTPPNVIFASGDSIHDAPQKLAGFVGRFDPTFVGVTGKRQEEIAEFASTIGATIVTRGNGADQYVIGHSGALFVVDPTGRVAAVLTGPFTVPNLQSDFHAMTAGF